MSYLSYTDSVCRRFRFDRNRILLAPQVGVAFKFYGLFRGWKFRILVDLESPHQFDVALF